MFSHKRMDYWLYAHINLRIFFYAKNLIFSPDQIMSNFILEMKHLSQVR